MATPKPGEIRCPTCHRSTPPAAFCTQCGSAIPPDARIRPRGMDRDELQDRIRARRSGGEPYRRGGDPGDETGYQRYEPDPIDTQARRQGAGEQVRHDYLDESDAAAAAGGAMAAEDITRDRDEWARPASAPTPVAAPPPAPEWAPPPSDVPVGDPDQPDYVDNFDDDAYDPAEYPAYDEWREPERRGGLGAVAILGFLALGVLALLSGAVLAGLFGGGGPQVGGLDDASPTASPVLTAEPTPSSTPEASASADSSASPGASGEPVVFEDGFTAEAEPCIRGSWTATGCNSNGASNSGSVDIWVGFENGTSEDVIGATLVAPDGSTVDGSIDLARLGCGASCTGYTYFPFDADEPGTYEVRITRNGELAATTTFEVT